MILVETLKEPSSGFIIGDSCVFGVELIKLTTAKAKDSSGTQHVHKKNGFSAQEAYTWVIDDFLTLKGWCSSPEFEIGRRKWYLTMYPSRIDGNENFLSLYLHMSKPDRDASLQNSGVMVEVSLSIKDKVTNNHSTKTGRCQFQATEDEEGEGWGWAKFMAMKSEVCEGLVPCEGQLLNRGRCCHRWIIQDGIGDDSLLVCVCRANIGIVHCGFCFVVAIFLNFEPECACTLQNA